MKPVILMFCFLVFAIKSTFSQTEDLSSIQSEGLVAFANSSDAINYINFYHDDGFIDVTSSYSVLEENSRKYMHYLAIKAKRTNNLIGYLQGVMAKSDYTKIPNAGRYFMIYRDYTNFDLPSKTGILRYYDANYDNFFAGEIEVDQDRITMWQTNDMPQDIAAKYNFDSGNIEGRTHHCDINHNGDVTFSECYKCMKDACDSNPNCMTQCDWYITCNTSIRITCAVVAMWH